LKISKLNISENKVSNKIKPLVCGHRGACGHAPENTLTAFRRALEMGASWVEFDVQLSADGVPIIFHDDTLERTTNLGRSLRPVELRLDALKQLDVGSWFGPQFAGETIPTLDEVLEQFGASLNFNIEIKSKPGFEADNGVEGKVAEAVRRYALLDKVVVSSFDPFRLLSLHRLDPEVRLGLLYTSRASDYPPGFDPMVLALSFDAVALHPPHNIVDADLVERTHAKGLAINTWTINDLDEMARLIELDVDMIITNYPDRLVGLKG
jgi:glycerophosphoryl diester phosphodiesterase